MEVRHETERPLLTKRNENFCKCICISINNIDQKFSFTFGSHYNRNENVLIWIMLTISLSAKVLRITFARKDEAAGNSEPLSRAPGLQARRGAQDFRRGKSDAALRGNLNVFCWDVSSLRAESPKGIASLSSEAAGLLQSFITSFAGSVSHKSLPSARYRLCRCV